jgi:hypothetical protein
LAPAGTPSAVIQELAKHTRKARIALAGHEPNLGELAAKLIAGRRQSSSRRHHLPDRFRRAPAEGCRPARWLLPPKSSADLLRHPSQFQPHTVASDARSVRVEPERVRPAGADLS